jgi:RNase H-fold protein (predicted Holliday junction resolvase)
MPRPRSTAPCTAPGCQRQSRAGGLCHAHYQQRLRGRELRALEARVARVRLSSVRVTESCAAALLEAGRATGDPASVAASRILESWARGLLVAVPRPPV